MATTSPTAPRCVSRSAHLGLRATPEQERMLRWAAAATGKSLTDFILESACEAAKRTPIDKRLFVVSGDQAQSLLDLLNRPAEDNARLRDLFSRPEPWEKR
jgi:uncharacterized protein (DUF1778 family)